MAEHDLSKQIEAGLKQLILSPQITDSESTKHAPKTASPSRNALLRQSPSAEDQSVLSYASGSDASSTRQDSDVSSIFDSPQRQSINDINSGAKVQQVQSPKQKLTQWKKKKRNRRKKTADVLMETLTRTGHLKKEDPKSKDIESSNQKSGKPNGVKSNENEEVVLTKGKDDTQKQDNSDKETIGETLVAVQDDYYHKDLLAQYEAEYLFPLKKKSVKFPTAKFFCRLCDYHCFDTEHCAKHCKDTRHVRLKKVKSVDLLLRGLPAPTEAHIEAMDRVLVDIYDHHSLSSQEYEKRQSAVLCVEGIIQNIDKDLKTTLYGSSLTGFALNTSDVNIDFNSSIEPKYLKEAHICLKKSKKGLVSEVRSDFSAKVPCVYFTLPKLRLKCQLAINNTGSHKTSQLLHLYQQIDPRVRKLGFIFRYMAQVCKIDKQDEGTLPAYVFPLMTVFFLQQCKPPVLPVLHTLNKQPSKDPAMEDWYFKDIDKLNDHWECKNTSSVGELWIQMLRFYSVEFDIMLHVISIRQPELLKRQEKKWASKKLAIEDPFMRRRNVARSVSHLQVFEYITERLRAAYQYFAIPQTSKGPLFSDMEGLKLEKRLREKLKRQHEKECREQEEAEEPEPSDCVEDAAAPSTAVAEEPVASDGPEDAAAQSTADAEEPVASDGPENAAAQSTADAEEPVALEGTEDAAAPSTADADVPVGSEGTEDAPAPSTGDVATDVTEDAASPSTGDAEKPVASDVMEDAAAPSAADAEEPLASDGVKDYSAPSTTDAEEPMASDVTEDHAAPSAADVGNIQKVSDISSEVHENHSLESFVEHLVKNVIEKALKVCRVQFGSSQDQQVNSEMVNQSGEEVTPSVVDGHNSEVSNAKEESCIDSGVVGEMSVAPSSTCANQNDIAETDVKSSEDVDITKSSVEPEKTSSGMDKDSDLSSVDTDADSTDRPISQSASESPERAQPTAVKGPQEDSNSIEDLLISAEFSHNLQVEDFQFKFSEDTLYDNKGPAIMCSLCQQEGHLKSVCPEENLPTPKPLPPMNSGFLNHLNSVLHSVPGDFMPQLNELRMRQSVVDELQAAIRETYNDAFLELFGSSCNGFGFHGSDLDICLTFGELTTPEEIDAVVVIEKLAKVLKKQRNLYNVFPITTAKVPIVKFKHRPTQLEGDISLYNTLAIENTRMLQTYADMDERVKIIGYTMKVFAKICDICDASRGSLSSYAYILLVLHFLQQREPPVIPVLQELYPSRKEKPEKIIDGWNAWFNDDISKLHKTWPHFKKNKESAAELWIGLLRYYTEEFNFRDYVITIRQKTPLTKFEKLWNHRTVAIEVNMFIIRTLRNARNVFGSPVPCIPNGYSTIQNYLFDPNLLTDSLPPSDRNCHVCGKIGHFAKECPIAESRKQEKQTQQEQQKKAKAAQREKPEAAMRGSPVKERSTPQNIPQRPEHQQHPRSSSYGHTPPDFRNSPGNRPDYRRSSSQPNSIKPLMHMEANMRANQPKHGPVQGMTPHPRKTLPQMHHNNATTQQAFHLQNTHQAQAHNAQQQFDNRQQQQPQQFDNRQQQQPQQFDNRQQQQPQQHRSLSHVEQQLNRVVQEIQKHVPTPEQQMLMQGQSPFMDPRMGGARHPMPGMSAAQKQWVSPMQQRPIYQDSIFNQGQTRTQVRPARQHKVSTGSHHSEEEWPSHGSHQRCPPPRQPNQPNQPPQQPPRHQGQYQNFGFDNRPSGPKHQGYNQANYAQSESFHTPKRKAETQEYYGNQNSAYYGNQQQPEFGFSPDQYHGNRGNQQGNRTNNQSRNNAPRGQSRRRKPNQK